MKVALVNPPMDFDTALGRAKNIGKYTVMIPHGLASIAAVLRANGIGCIIIDGYAENLSIEEISGRIVKYGPAVVGISAVTPVINIVHAIAKNIKLKLSSVKVVLGGPHPSILPDEVMTNPDVDFIVRGEGEYSFLSLLKAIDGDTGLEAVPGISYRVGAVIKHNKPSEYIENLDELPQPAYDLLPMRLYTAPPQWSIASPSYQIIATRGCPFYCGFCCVGMGRRVRYKSAACVCDEIEYLIENHHCRQIVFVDTTFPFNYKHAESVCGEMIKRGLNKKVVWFTSTRVDTVDGKMLRLMHKAGCRLVTFGVESGNQDILNDINKNITLKQIREAVKMANMAKIDITASYILGLPGETKETMFQTLEFAKRLNTLYAQFNIIVPYPGTKVFDCVVKEGLLRNRNWNNYVSLTSMTDLEPPFIAAGLTKEELLNFQRKAYSSYYLRPAIMFKHLKKLMLNFEFKKYFLLTRVLLDTFKG